MNFGFLKTAFTRRFNRGVRNVAGCNDIIQLISNPPSPLFAWQHARAGDFLGLGLAYNYAPAIVIVDSVINELTVSDTVAEIDALTPSVNVSFTLNDDGVVDDLLASIRLSGSKNKPQTSAGSQRTAASSFGQSVRATPQ